MAEAQERAPATSIEGVLHVYCAFDWGDEIDLERASKLVPAEPRSLPRRSRTPSSIAYQPSPLWIDLPAVALQLPVLGNVAATLDVTVFDFGAASAAVHVPFRLDAAALVTLADACAEPEALVGAIRAAVAGLFDRLKPSIRKANFSELSEEYFVFQILPGAAAAPAVLLERHKMWLGAIVRLEGETLSDAEVAEALRLHLSYSPRDLLVPDWAAAVIIDDNCDELLDVIAFANLQLLEFRYLDQRLDRRLEETYGMIHQLAHAWLPFWRTHARPLRALGALKIEVNVMLERSASALKLVGEPYLARAFHLLATRFHLDEWGEDVRRSIALLEGTYQVVSDQAATYRTEVLELIIVLLIVFEIVMAFVRR